MKPESSQGFCGVGGEVADHQFEAMVVGGAVLAASLTMVIAAVWQWLAG